MNARQLDALRQMERHTFREHGQRILDLLDDRHSFIDVRETCAECVRLMRAMGAHECADEYEARGVRDLHGEGQG